MSKQKELGKKGEDIAASHLESLGYDIVERNWYFLHYEIDIIAKDLQQNELVIVEVKSRTGDSYEHPSEAVSNRKIRFLVEAAEAYIMEKDSNLDTRFDVISIIFYGHNFHLEHFKDAFYPSL